VLIDRLIGLTMLVVMSAVFSLLGCSEAPQKPPTSTASGTSAGISVEISSIIRNGDEALPHSTTLGGSGEKTTVKISLKDGATWPSGGKVYLHLLADGEGDAGNATLSQTEFTEPGIYTVNVIGTAQTGKGRGHISGGPLRIGASNDNNPNNCFVKSSGFSVCVHPNGITFTNGVKYKDSVDYITRGGMKVDQVFTTDGGTAEELSEVDTYEEVSEGLRKSGSFDHDTVAPHPYQGAKKTGNNLEFDLHLLSIDGNSRAWYGLHPYDPAGGPGSVEFEQLWIYQCRRCGMAERAVPSSGALITQTMDSGPNQLKTAKIGKPVTVAGVSSTSASGNESIDADFGE